MIINKKKPLNKLFNWTGYSCVKIYWFYKLFAASIKLGYAVYASQLTRRYTNKSLILFILER